MSALNFIDLFAGAGGLSEGFIRAGYTPLAHIEKDKFACDTIKTRAAFHFLIDINQLDIHEEYLYQKQEKEDGSKLWAQVPKRVTDTVIQCEIGEKTIAGIFKRVNALIGEKKADIIVGGPPCQAYSVIGRARMKEKALYDPRNDLYKYYVEFLKKYQPKMFVFENVMGIRSAKNGEPLKDLTRLVEKAGYKMELKVQTASEHGVLQNRQRVIIIGWKEKDENGKPTGFCYPDLEREETPYEVLNDLFSDLPQRKAGEGELCSPVKYVKHDGYSHTVITHIAMDRHYYIYPTLNPSIDNVRSITIREATRLQSYYFEGSRSSAFKQIGKNKLAA